MRYYLDNSIPILTYTGNKEDRELLKLMTFLKSKILGAIDVRDVIRNFFRF